MKVAFVTTYDASDVHHWSGLGFFISRALANAGLDIEPCGPLRLSSGLQLLLRARSFWFNRVRKERYMRNHDLLVARHHARAVDRWLAGRPDIDLIFSPGVIPVALVQDRRPLATWSDATHGVLFDYYPEYSNLSRATRRDGHRIEQTALDRAAAALFSSDWAAESARHEYGVPDVRAHVVPFGANLEQPPDDESVERSIARRLPAPCRLLFAGVDWKRKGGPFVLEVLEQLNRSRLVTELTVVGCDPFGPGQAPPFVRVEGFVSKATAEGQARLDALFREHHFLVLPSAAECYGLVYCEACAYGLPTIARRTGGVPTIIRDGENGRLFDPSAPAAEVAAAIRALFTDHGRYLSMARETRRHYRERLNWDVAGRCAADILRLCPQHNPLRLG
jgi:glycosyltransferase involved in cell wall biosynthesis